MAACEFCGTKHRADSGVTRISSNIDTVADMKLCKTSGRAFVQLESPSRVFNDPTARQGIDNECRTRIEWKTGKDGTTSEELIGWATDGWPDAPTETAEILWDSGYRDSFIISDQGYEGIDAAAYAAGDPDCFIDYRPAESPVPAPVKAIANCSYSYRVDAADVLVWSEAMSIAMQTVRVAGGQVEMWGCNTTDSSSHSGRRSIVWPIADSRYPLPVAVEAFIAGHPSILRVMSFAIDDSITTEAGWYEKGWGKYTDKGIPASVDLFSLPAEWHDSRIIPGPTEYQWGYTNVYGEKRDRGLGSQTRDSMVEDIMGALGWQVR